MSSFDGYRQRRQPEPSLADAAIALGVPVFPCDADKKPLPGTRGFKDASAEPGVVRAMFAQTGAALIGMPTGAASGVVVVDVDMGHGAQGAAWLDANTERLPQTRTIRTRSGGLHLYYVAPLDDVVRNQQSKIAPNIDVRGAGGYVIVPPSEGYSVADNAAPAAIPKWLLPVLVPPPVRTYAPSSPPPSGSRRPTPQHGGTAYGMAALADECEAIRCAPFGQQEHTLNAAALKIGSLIAGGELQEGTAVAELLAAGRSMGSQPGRPPWHDKDIDRKVRRAVQDGMSRARTAPGPQPEPIHPAAGLIAKAHAKVAGVIAKPLPVLPQLMDVGGIIEMFVDHCNQTAISPQPFLALAAGICAVGALAGRRYRTRTDLRTNIYAVGIADSGGGKDHARKQIKVVFGQAGLTQYLGGEDIASGAAMLTALNRHPAILFQIDEFGDWLAGVLGKQANPHKRQVAEKLKTLYSSADSFIPGTEYANQGTSGRPREDIHQPHACLYGTTTPGQFWSAIAGGSMHDGLLARVMMFVTDQSYPDEADAVPSKPSEALVKAFKAVAAGATAQASGNLGVVMSGATASVPYLVPESPGAERAIKKLRAEQLVVLRQAEGTYVTAIVARWGENAVKLALVRAVSRDPAWPTISEADVAWGRALARHCINTLLQDADRHVADTEFERTMNKAREIIRKHGPISESQMIKQGFRLSSRDRAEVLRTLVQSGMAIEIPTQHVGPGRPTVRYATGTSPGSATIDFCTDDYDT